MVFLWVLPSKVGIMMGGPRTLPVWAGLLILLVGFWQLPPLLPGQMSGPAAPLLVLA